MTAILIVCAFVFGIVVGAICAARAKPDRPPTNICPSVEWTSVTIEMEAKEKPHA